MFQIRPHSRDSWLYICFPDGAGGKESTCLCRRLRRHKFDLWVWKIPWSRKWQPTPVSLPGKFHGQKSLVGCKESDMTDWLSMCTRVQNEKSTATFRSKRLRIWKACQHPLQANSRPSCLYVHAYPSAWFPCFDLTYFLGHQSGSILWFFLLFAILDYKIHLPKVELEYYD